MMPLRFYLVPFLWGFVPALLLTLYAVYVTCWQERQVAVRSGDESNMTLVKRRLSAIDWRGTIIIPLGAGSIVLVSWILVYVTTVGVPK